MLKYIIVIALALPVCVLAENNKPESWIFEPQCINGKNEKVNSAYGHYNMMLTSYIQKKDSESLANLKASVTNFVTIVNETCAEGKMPNNMNTSFFIDLIEFAIKDDKFSKFTNSNGISCVNGVKTDIQKCLRDHLGTPAKPKATANNAPPHGAGGNVSNVNATGVHDIDLSGDNVANGGNGSVHALYITNGRDAVAAQMQIKQNVHSLLKKTSLEFNEYACDKTKAIKKCISFEMKKHNATCTTEHSKFVESLFDFSLDKCPKPLKAAYKTNFIFNLSMSGANSFLFSPVVILLPLFGTMLIN